ncbi:MAG: hypothetical protein OXS30_11995 [Chloroflexota bacterium]|nr:hypothetical protein [Chloroflexota bacterium]
MNGAAQAIQQFKPPVAYTPEAIKAGIAFEAANGPAYVRIKALNMMARIVGLYEQGKALGKQAAAHIGEQVQPDPNGVLARFAQVLAEGVDLADLSMFDSSNNEEAAEDEDGSSHDEDEPP